MRGPWGEQRMLTGFPDEVYPHGEEGGGVGRKVTAAYNSKTIHGIQMKFDRVVENHKLLNLV